MQLRLARLCLDCEEIHDEYRCPVCASDQFSYLTRWVPTPEPRDRPRPMPPPPPTDVDVYRQLIRDAPAPPRKGRLLTRALVGLSAAGLAGLFFGVRGARATRQPSDEDSGDLP